MGAAQSLALTNQIVTPAPRRNGLRSKLDWTYGLIAWTAIAAPLGMLSLDGSGDDVIDVIASALRYPALQTAFRGFVLFAVISEVPVSLLAMVLAFRFRRRRRLLALALANVLVVMRYALYPLLDEALPNSLATLLATRGPIVVYGFLGLAESVAWFARGRRRLGPDADASRAGLADPFWPHDGPVSRSQFDLAYGCFAWATFGWRLAVLVLAQLPTAATYFAVQVLPATGIVAAMTGLWGLPHLRLRWPFVLTAVLAVGVGVDVYGAEVEETRGVLAQLSEAPRLLEILAMIEGVELKESALMSIPGAFAVPAGWLSTAALVVGPLLVLGWCLSGRLSRATFDTARDQNAWHQASFRLEPASDSSEVRTPGAPRVLGALAFWLNAMLVAYELVVFVWQNGGLLHDMWLELQAFGRDDIAVLGQLAPFVFSYGLARSYLVLLVVPPLFVVPVAALVGWRWKHPPSALLLRPFHRGKGSRPLSALVRRELASKCHVYSLADADIHVPWYVTLSTVVGQLSILNFGYREITRPRQLESLLRSLRRPWLRTINWTVSRNRVFSISCSDSAWVPVVTALVSRVDVIVLDLSVWSENVGRELELCSQPSLASRLICLANQHSAVFVRSRLDEDPRWRDLPLHVYDETGRASTLAANVLAVLQPAT